MGNAHAEWFAEINGGLSPYLSVRQHLTGPAVFMLVDGPFATREAALIALEQHRREIDDLIFTAPAEVEAARGRD